MWEKQKSNHLYPRDQTWRLKRDIACEKEISLAISAAHMKFNIHHWELLVVFFSGAEREDEVMWPAVKKEPAAYAHKAPWFNFLDT